MHTDRLVLVSLLLLSACRPAPAPESVEAPASAAPALSVQTTKAVKQAMPLRLPLVGTLIADRQAQVASDSNGVVERTLFERGQSVKKGQVLAIIDSRTSSLAAAANSAQSRAQAAQAEVAAKDCERAAALFQQGVIPKAQYERTQAACVAQANAAEAARASASLAASNLDRTKVKAPFDGVIGERLVEVGAFVGPASPVATLYAAGPLRVRMSVPETQSRGVLVGNKVSIRPTALDEALLSAKVQYVAGAIREQTRDLIVEAVLDAEDGRLRPGMSVRVEMDVGSQDLVVVPEAALRTTDGVSSVFVVVDGVAQQRVVRLGARAEGLVAVLTDLAEGDAVVVDPPASLRDGSRVN